MVILKAEANFLLKADMAKSELEKITHLYAALMTEIKLRIQEAYRLREETDISPFVLYESCFLQIRLICECIALACLLAHGDISAARSKRAFKAYQADWIIKMLSQADQNFYPVSLDKDTTGTDGVVTWNDRASDFLTKEDLIKLLKKTGSVLHKGSLKSLINNERRVGQYREIDDALEKIVKLLNSHIIHSRTVGKILHCTMHTKAISDPAGSEKVSVSIFTPL